MSSKFLSRATDPLCEVFFGIRAMYMAVGRVSRSNAALKQISMVATYEGPTAIGRIACNEYIANNV